MKEKENLPWRICEKAQVGVSKNTTKKQKLGSPFLIMINAWRFRMVWPRNVWKGKEAMAAFFLEDSRRSREAEQSSRGTQTTEWENWGHWVAWQEGQNGENDK